MSGRRDARRLDRARPQRRVITHLLDLAWILLLGLLLPVWMLLALAGIAIVVGRQIYLWARGNTTRRPRRLRRLRGPAAPSLPPASSGT